MDYKINFQNKIYSGKVSSTTISPDDEGKKVFVLIHPKYTYFRKIKVDPIFFVPDSIIR